MSYSEAITKNDLKKILGNVGFGSLNDYIIEQGTSGIWTYRKWKSGVAECWGKRTVTVDITNSWGSLYVSTTSIKETYPANLFIEAPTDGASLSSNYSGILMPSGSIPTSATATAERAILKGWSGANQYHIINYYSKGKWKNDIDTYQGIGSIGAVLLDTFHPVGSYYETSDANFNPNTAWGGTWTKETSAVLCTAENVTTRIKTFSISRARGSHADVTAPTVTDYTFVAWVATATQGWVGSVYPAQPTAQTATFWVSVSDGNTNNMNVNAVALYRKNDNSINRWHRTA